MNYTEQVIDHFTNQRNIGIIREPSVLIQVGDPECGDSFVIDTEHRGRHGCRRQV